VNPRPIGLLRRGEHEGGPTVSSQRENGLAESLAAVQAGELPSAVDCDEIAALVVASLQGANLLAKAQQNPRPVDRFKQVLFSRILR